MGTFQQEGQHDDWHIQTGGSSSSDSREGGKASASPSAAEKVDPPENTASVVDAITSTITTRKRSITAGFKDNLLFSSNEELCYYTVTIKDGDNLVSKLNNDPYLKVC